MVRFKKRYLVVKVFFEDGKVDDSLTKADLFNAVRDSLIESYGDYGAASALEEMKVKYFNPKTNTAFVQSAIEYYRQVWVALTFAKNIDERRCMVTLLHVTGTLRSCEKFILQYNAKELRKQRIGVGSSG